MAIVRKADHEDVEALAAFAGPAFAENFGHLYRPENLQHHLTTQCSPEYFARSLDKGEVVLMLHDQEKLIGYAKVGQVIVPAETPPAGSLEIHRLYVTRERQGRGYGKQMMLSLLSLPHVQVAPMVYLSVWEENLRAQALYTWHGFKPVGRYLFQVGDQADNEMIMGRARA